MNQELCRAILKCLYLWDQVDFDSEKLGRDESVWVFHLAKKYFWESDSWRRSKVAENEIEERCFVSWWKVL